MDLYIDRDSPLPLREQITGQIRLHIDAGRLRPGDPLPTIKTNALELGVHANTVAAAYKELEEEGYLSQRKRAGTTVASNPPRRMAGILAERLAADASAKARAAGLETSDLIRAVAAHAVLASAGPRLRVAVLGETELEAGSMARRAEAVLGDDVEFLPLTPERYDSVDYHLTVLDAPLTRLLMRRPGAPGVERTLPTHLRYGPEFPAGAD